MFRTIILSLVGVAVIVVADGFAWLNPGKVTMDIGVGVYEMKIGRE